MPKISPPFSVGRSTKKSMKTIPASHQSLLNTNITVIVATIMPNGQPQLTPVWSDYQDGLVLFNTAKGRQKDLNLQRNPRVTILAIDPTDNHFWIEVRGHVVERTTEGAVEHIDKVSKRYTRKGYETWRPEEGETRVIYKIQPDSVNIGE